MPVVGDGATAHVRTLFGASERQTAVACLHRGKIDNAMTRIASPKFGHQEIWGKLLRMNRPVELEANRLEGVETCPC